ncbi:N-acetylmuramoyl-L-alanine amidase [Pelagibacterium montanilacus]|uniref:N-acetylmuramoyl-L-alanine amidase n=1 Tax=Pelagibacterium montanilacus TaxID=2185280 RepID=UPI000F8C63DC|nr:N-acetylmuramoyl-L-alanine amidase [Pelagibacterium montanilacus]
MTLAYRRQVAGFLLVLVSMFFASSAMGQEAAPQAEADGAEIPAVLDSRVTTTTERGRLVLDLTGPTEFAYYTLTDPARLVVELRAQAGDPREHESAGPGVLVPSHTLEALGADRVRVELALNGPAQVQQSYILEPFEDQPARLVLDLIPDTAENFAANARQQDQADGPSVAGATVLDGQETAPGQTAGGGSPNARPLIVIDPGHGGVDGGARSTGGLEEKNIVLAFALKLESILAETGRFDIALTRDTDVFLGLEDRLGLARQNQANLFVSLHADSFDQEDVRGASVYTRGDLVLDAMDRALAENENRADLVGGFDLPPDEPAVVDVLVDFLGRETRRQSYIAARAMVDQLEPSIQLRRFPLRQADFVVLRAPDIPSVLVELGFLSNRDDSENLATDAWLDRVATALARGIAIYFDEIEQPTPTLAAQ